MSVWGWVYGGMVDGVWFERRGALVGGEVGWEGMVCWGGEVQGLTLSSGGRVDPLSL